MDYTIIPRELVYKDKISLEAYSSANDYNKIIIQNLINEEILTFGEFEMNVLLCFNRAYYILTMIKMENDPCMRIEQYKNIAACRQSNLLYQAVTLSVINILAAHSNDEKFRKFSLIFERFDKYIHSLSLVKSTVNPITRKAEITPITDIFEKINKNISEGKDIPESEFLPRNIDKDAIVDLPISVFRWNGITDNYTKDYVEDIIKNIGNSQEEKYLVWKLILDDTKVFYDSNEYYKDYVIPTFNSIKELLLPDIVKKEKAQEETQVQEQEDKKREGLTAKECALFCEALASKCDFDFTNKKNELAPMAHSLFGYGIRSIANKLTEGYSKEERERVASIFDNLSPDFADVIRNVGKK